jgi:hypothetical protein
MREAWKKWLAYKPIRYSLGHCLEKL